MRAVLRVRPGEVSVVDRPTPEPGPGEVLLRVRACGLCGSDLTRLRDSDDKWNRVVLGHECSGVVESLGPSVSGGTGVSPVSGSTGLPACPAVGDRVALLPLLPDFTCPYCRRGDFALCDNYGFFGSRQDGGLGEYLVVPATNVLPVPDQVDDESAALLEPLSVATKACLLAGLAPVGASAPAQPPVRQSPGRRTGACGSAALRQTRPYAEPVSVLIMGAGPIGLLAVQVALALGATTVIACDVLPERLALAAALGAETVLSVPPSPEGRGGQGDESPSSPLPAREGGRGVGSAVRDLTSGRGVDLCLECSGHHAAVGPALDSLAKGGTLVLVGTGPGEVALTGEQREQICRRMLTIRGQWMSYGPAWPGEAWTVPLALLTEGRLDPRRLITHRFPLDQAPEAVRLVLTPGADVLKVMFTT